ncbi:carbohydrate-binding protein [Achlya hypogyna]|uniref:Carbohydrate-binding protein n=1 Tax=Achlya hypogyna TaxID=1202772 RepID=A0A1V9YB57_ACHHY|nr:carbohydrate-binding protein [Achlya hypogyna]
MFGSFGGQTAAAPASTGFSFGAPAAAASTTTPAFGSTSTSGFGSTAAAPAASSGFTFGNNTASTAATTQPASSFGSFGASTTPAAPSATGFSFGAAAPATTPSTTASTGFSFGGTTAPSSGFNFGGASTPAAAPATSSGFSFGNAAAPAASTPFAFGSTAGSTAPATGGFGGFGAPAQQPQSGLFQLSAATTNAFPAGSANALAAATTAAANSPMESLTGIRMAYMDPQQSRFKHMLYNAVDPAQKHLYVRPPHISEKLWTQAQRDNPDPANCVPAAVIGFKELSTRIKLQHEHADKFTKYAEDMVAQVKEMEKTSRDTDVKLAQCRHQHVALFHRLVQLMRKLEVFKNLRKPLHAEEVRLMETLKKVAGLLDNPTQFKARMNELMALQAMQEAKPHQDSEQCQLSEHDLHLVYGIMDRQRQGLEHVTKVLAQDMRDVEIMQRALADDDY